MSEGIFPDVAHGGIAFRDADGNDLAPGGTGNNYVPDAAFAASGAMRCLPTGCTARFDGLQINAIVAEMLALAEYLDANGPWTISALTNLRDRFAAWVTSQPFASEAYVDAAIAALIDASPGALDTLNELAAALGDDANFASTVTTALAGKVPTSRLVSAGGLATGGGDLSADRTITVTEASEAEAEARTASNVVLTPRRFLDATQAAAIDISSTDINSLLDTGLYSGNNLTNAPSTAFYFLEVFRYSGPNNTLQRAHALNSAGLSYMRWRISGSWSAWLPLANTGTALSWTAHQSIPLVALTDAANIDWAVAAAQKAKVTLGGNRTMNAVTGAVEGTSYLLWVIQDGTGSRTISWTTTGAGSFDFGTDGAPTLTTTASRADLLCFEAISIGGTLKLRFAGIKKGFA